MSKSDTLEREDLAAMLLRRNRVIGKVIANIVDGVEVSSEYDLAEQYLEEMQNILLKLRRQ